MDKSKTKKQLLQEIEDLRIRLAEAEETLRAIRAGEVDALIIDSAQGNQVYTLQGADRPYRVLWETMEEGAGILGRDGTVLYGNRRLAEMLRTPLERVMGSSLRHFLSPEDWQILKEMGEGGKRDGHRAEVRFKTGDGSWLSALVSLGSMEAGDFQGICLTATDLTEQKQAEEALLRSRNELEKKVQERTEDLTRTNRRLLSEIQKRNRAAEALRRSEERLALAASGTGIGIFEWDIAGGKVLWTRQHDIIFGYRAQDSTTTTTTTTTTTYDYRHWADRVHPEDLPWVEEEVRRCLKERKPFDFQYRIVWPDGSVHWVQTKGVFACDDQGQTSQMMGITQDISERKQAEQALRESEAKYRIVSDHTNDWEFWLAPDGRFLYCSPSCERITGHTPEEFLADPSLRGTPIHPDDRERFEAHLNSVERAQVVGEDEWRFLRPNGTYRWVAHVCRPVFDETGRFLGVRGSNRDITERKRMEETSRQNERLLRTMIRNLPEAAAFVIDRDLRYRVADGHALYAVGMKPEDLEGKTIFESLAPSVAASHEPYYRQALAGRPFKNEHQSHGRFFISHGVPLRNDLGEVEGALVLSYDITERKRIEKELEERKQHLETLLENLPIGVWFADKSGKILYGNAAGKEIWQGARYVNPEEFHEYKAWWADTGVPLGPDDWAVTRAVRNGEISLNEVLRIECFDGSQKLINNSAVPLRTQEGQLFGVVALNEDITERVRMEGELRRSETRFKLLSITAERLLKTENPQRVVDELCREVMAHLDCQVFFNFLAAEGIGRLHLNAYAGIPEEEARKIEWLDYGVAVCGCVARDGLPILAEDIFHIPDPRTELVKSYGIQAYACHPLKVSNRLIGTLSFGTKTRDSFSDDDLSLMRMVTDQVSTAMERTRLFQELQKSRDELEQRVLDRTEELTKSQKRLQQLASQLLQAQEKERKRVAVELHDGLLSELAATKFLLEGKVMLLERGLPVDPGDLRRVADILGGAMKEARRLMNNLHPSTLDELGLIATIGWLCGEYQKAYPHIAVRKEIAVSEGDVAAEVRVVVYRVLQEALNNFARHGKGDRIEISIAKFERGFSFEIRDNGQGFDVENQPKGLGLESMRERVEVSGGEFRIKSAIGQGTTIRAVWTCP